MTANKAAAGNPITPVLTLFFLSGAAGLIYEISWARQIGLLFGHTVYASAITLGAYFSGMALGYALASRLVARLQRPLRAYGVAEMVVASWAVVTPLLLRLLELPGVAVLVSPSDPVVQLAVRSLVAFFMLLPANVALGATLPCVAEYLGSGTSTVRHVSLAYGLNTLGAVVGVCAATFVLMLELGVRGCGYFAAAVSAACGVVALALPAQPRAVESTVRAVPISVYWYTIVALTGGTTLALEVLYTRLFALSLQNSTYTFGVVIAVFLMGLALGSLLVSRYRDGLEPRVWIGRAALATALLIPMSLLVYGALTEGVRVQVSGGFGRYVAAVGGVVAVVVLPVVVALGAILPICWVAVRGNVGSAVGRLTAVNTVAAALGSLLASFVLLPLVGLWHSFSLIACVYAGLACVALGRGGHRLALGLSGVAAIAALWVGVWLPQRYHGYDVTKKRLVGRWESAYGLIDVLEHKKTKQLDLRHNGLYRLSSSKLAAYEVRQGHIPLLLHPNPKRVLYLGMGSGITSSSALYHPEVECADIVELIPSVVSAARKFALFNRDVLDADKVHVYLNDARHFLLGAQQRYDVIVSDLFIPWESKTGYLYTVEHYRTARQHIAPGGLFCQWIHLWEVGERELELIVDSFTSIFPNVTLWKGDMKANVPTLGIVGSDDQLRIDGAQLAARMRVLPEPPRGSRILSMPSALLNLYIGRWPRREGAALNTDEHPRVEFLAPLANRDGTLRRRGRLLRYYEQVLTKLDTSGVNYTDVPGAPLPNLRHGRYLQLAKLRRRLDKSQ